MDDHLFATESLSEALAVSSEVDSIFAAVGLPCNSAKHDIGQRLVFAGFLIDTTRMSLSFDQTSCAGFAMLVRHTVAVIANGHNPELSTLRSIRGKINHLAQLTQLGRLFLRGLNKVVPNEATYIAALNRHRYTVLNDLEFWTQQLDTWSTGHLSGREFPILNSSVFERDTHKVLCLITDASGLADHGFGGTETYLFDDTCGPVFAVRWSAFLMLADHSHGQELQALLWWLLHTDKRDIIVFWFSDSSSAVWSLNKGYCANADSFGILFQILDRCDVIGIWVVGFWLPREWNLLADHTTHLTSLLDRDFISCSVADLATAP